MSTSIGAALRAARERRKLTLTQVSETTRIRPKFLQALEDDDLSAMTSSAQARGFLRIYAALLDLDLEALIPEAQTGSEAAPAVAPPASTPPRAPDSDQAEQASRPGLLARLRERLSGGSRAEAPQDAEGASVPGPPVPADEPRAPGPEAPGAAIGKKKARV
ncbi:MAG TPA: helix-turn-helix domain-containing protein [Anaerolineales bacterium]|nr:helix-turn-helix domain-containing protein [Anaerolineales bacterium]